MIITTNDEKGLTAVHGRLTFAALALASAQSAALLGPELT
jgi:hypothetical protein